MNVVANFITLISGMLIGMIAYHIFMAYWPQPTDLTTIARVARLHRLRSAIAPTSVTVPAEMRDMWNRHAYEYYREFVRTKYGVNIDTYARERGDRFPSAPAPKTSSQ